MKSCSFLKLIAGAFALLSSPAADALPATEKEQNTGATLIKQRHEYFGDVRIYFTHDAVRVIFDNKGTIVVAKAPAWNVTEYSPQTKVAYQASFKDWMKGGLSMDISSDDAEDMRFKKEGANFIGDEKATKYIGVDKRARARYWIDEQIDCPLSASLIIQRLYRLPIIKTGFPLELSASTMWQRDKNSIVWLPPLLKKAAHPIYYCTLTTNDIRKVDLPKTEFDYPTNTRLVKHEDDVWLTAPTRSVMKAMMGALEPSQPKQASKQPLAPAVHH